MNRPQHVKINTPIWNGRKVGVNESLINEHGVNVEILYENKNGKRVFPHIYHASRYLAIQMPVQKKTGVRLRIIPISMMTIIKEQYDK